MSGPVRYELGGSTATLTLDSPENRNALTPQLLQGILDGLSRAEDDDAVRTIVLTHTGKVFCSGADLKGQSSTASGGSNSAEASPEDVLRERGRVSNEILRRLVSSPKPTVAVINGHVRAGGMGFVAACDVAIAGPRATFGLSEVRIGVVAATIAPLVLYRLNSRTAAEWFLRGNAVSAAEAVRAGFVTRAVDGENTTVDHALDEVLSDLRGAAPAALAASKRLVNRGLLARIDAEGDEMIDLSARFFASDDAQNGMKAFFAKSAPPWAVDS